MTYLEMAARLMSMSDEVWLRHANPWSGWTRVALFPLWFVALWSWTWLGWWALAPVSGLALCTWLNPRAFPPPTNDRSWMTRGVLGERILINSETIAIPRRHRVAAHGLSAAAAVGFGVAIVGFVQAELWLALGGWLLTFVFKMAFVDRMVRLYDVMNDASQEASSVGPDSSAPS